MKNCLLVIDLQKEFSDDKIYNKCIDFILKSQYDVVYATKFISGNKNFKKYLDWSFTKSPQDLEFAADIIIEKHGYGLDDYSILPPNVHYDIIGCETDACVLKVAYDLFDREYDFSILRDYVYSNAGDININDAINRNLKCFK